MSVAQPVFRFAPSPNGELHLGHAYSALLNLQMARRCNAKMLLRIEGIDTQRCTAALEKQMLEDLEWIGFEWDEEPIRQSGRFDLYQDALLKIDELGLLYASGMSRSEIKREVTKLESAGTPWPRDPDGSPIYPGKERELQDSLRKPLSKTIGRQIIRLDMAMAKAKINDPLFWNEMASNGNMDVNPEEVKAEPAVWGDVILARRDVPTSYHIACVIDDAAQGVTHVVRGKDLYFATAIHRLLQHLLGLPAPVYFHHELIRNDERQKLSKSDGHTSLRQLRNSGLSPMDVIDRMGLSLL